MSTSPERIWFFSLKEVHTRCKQSQIENPNTLPWTYSRCICKSQTLLHLYGQTAVLMQTEGLGHVSIPRTPTSHLKTVFLNLWDLTCRPSKTHHHHPPFSHASPQLQHCPHTAETLWVFVDLPPSHNDFSHVHTETHTHYVRALNTPLHSYLRAWKMYFLIYCVGSGGLFEKSWSHTVFSYPCTSASVRRSYSRNTLYEALIYNVLFIHTYLHDTSYSF